MAADRPVHRSWDHEWYTLTPIAPPPPGATRMVFTQVCACGAEQRVQFLTPDEWRAELGFPARPREEPPDA